MHYFSGFKSFWLVLNNQLFIDAMKKLNSRNKALSIATYEFSTHYMNIPHNKLKYMIRELIHYLFRGGEKQFTVVITFGATWAGNKNGFKISFDKDSLKRAVNFVLDNCLF